MERHVFLVLPPRPSSASVARELVISFCSEWHVEGLISDLSLVVSELVGNAIRHAGTDMVVRLALIEGGVRLEVHDGSTRPLRPRVAAPTDEGGRGLLLIAALSSRYGVAGEPDGKLVWAELLVHVPVRV